jgi:SAM-dependent methyltransferase
LSTKNEIEVYDSTTVSQITGETECYDNAFFPNVIRKKELKIIEQVLRNEQPELILDFGCGGGWLSILLQKWGYNFVGVDVSKKMVKNAKNACNKAEFVVCDAMKLPFKDSVFDFTIGISILHHLDLKHSTDELKRISAAKSTLFFMDPNLLNPFSAFGRKLFPMESHTEGEKPYTPQYLKMALTSAGFKIEKCYAMLFIAFPLARFSKITNLEPPLSIVRLTCFLEDFAEKMPGIRNLNSNIVTIITFSKDEINKT